MKIKSYCCIALLLTFGACSSKQETNQQDGAIEVHSDDFLAANIDSAIDPASDFFLYANNNWFKKNPIPASEPSNGLWQLIRDTINAQVREICEKASKDTSADAGSHKQKIGDMFFSGMDSVTINKSGLNGLKKELAQLSNPVNPKALAKACALVHLSSGSPLFGFYVSQDDKISSKHAIFLSQGGLSLPDRSFYFDTDERSKEVRTKFVAHVQRMFRLMGQDSIAALKTANDLMNMETSIAMVSRKREDTRDPHKNYNKLMFTMASKSLTKIDLKAFLAETGIKNPDTIIIGQPEFFNALDNILSNTSPKTVGHYLQYHYIKGLAPYLDDKTYAEHFSFYSTTMRGISEMKPRWKRVVDQTNSALGELIGQVYVEEYLPKGTKEKLQQIGNDIKTVYAERIKNLDWMSPATKEKALVKLNGMVMKVGYPDQWKDLSNMQINRDSYVRNVIAANRWEMLYMTNKFGKPVDRNEWQMYPQTYNAYYNPSNNEIVVPGSNIIVPGYERVMADDAILYSIIGGSTFGHEITHGFDDQGAKYDVNGNLENWWTTEDSTRFFAKTRMVVDQFNQYVVVDSLKINGEMTLGENIADIGGIMIGYEAFKKTKQFKDQKSIAGLNPDKRFFLGYALAWMINTRPESLTEQVKSDVHSPAKFRVVGPLANMKEFHRTFGVKPGDAMYRPDSLIVNIW